MQNLIIADEKFHSKFLGDKTGKTIQKKLNKSSSNRIYNTNLNLRLLNLKLKDLVPLDSQRFTKEKWVTDRLVDQEGLDMWAFGTLSVCYDSRDDKFYVWDGCGRHALATAMNLEEVPCVVIDGKKEQAAFYFAYSQERGRRTLSKEVLFVNRFYSGEAEAMSEAEILKSLGMYVQGDTDYSVPNPAPAGYINIGYRAFSEGLTISGNDINLCLQARNMIATAWGNNPNGCTVINQDIYWGLIKLLQVYPEARINTLNRALQQCLNGIAIQRDQNRVNWKPKGLSGNSGVAPILAWGLFEEFESSTHWKTHYSKNMPKLVLKELINTKKELINTK